MILRRASTCFRRTPRRSNTRPPATSIPSSFAPIRGTASSSATTNRTPKDLELDDFQVKTPTDIIGQHIHLVKFDVTSSDGSGNGWNYEDGTLAPDEVKHRIELYNDSVGIRPTSCQFRTRPIRPRCSAGMPIRCSRARRRIRRTGPSARSSPTTTSPPPRSSITASIRPSWWSRRARTGTLPTGEDDVPRDRSSKDDSDETCESDIVAVGAQGDHLRCRRR